MPAQPKKSKKSEPKNYLVRWEIDIWADNPVEAAAQALITQRDAGSSAVVFDILDPEDKAQQWYRVDLDEDHAAPDPITK